MGLFLSGLFAFYRRLVFASMVSPSIVQWRIALKPVPRCTRSVDQKPNTFPSLIARHVPSRTHSYLNFLLYDNVYTGVKNK